MGARGARPLSAGKRSALYSPVPGRPKLGARSSFKWVKEGKPPKFVVPPGGKFQEASRRRATLGQAQAGHRSTSQEVGEVSRSGPGSPLTPTVAPGAPLSRPSGGSSLEDVCISGTCDRCLGPGTQPRAVATPCPPHPGSSGTREVVTAPAPYLNLGPLLLPLLDFLSLELRSEQVAHFAVGSGPSALVINQIQPSSGLLPR